MKITKQALDVIKHFEGCSLTAYKCSAGVWTIGWGHTGKAAYKGAKITQVAADSLLLSELEDYEVAVSQLLGNALTQRRLDASVLFAYNVGLGALKSSTYLKYIKAGLIDRAAQELLKWDKANGANNGKDDDGDGLIDEAGEKQRLAGLTRRREAERSLLLGQETKLA